MSRALDVAAAWLRVREAELAFMSQQDETWREMIREGLFRTPPTQQMHTNPFSDIWMPRARRTSPISRARRARTVTQTADLRAAENAPRPPTWLAEWSNPVPIVATPTQIRNAIEEVDYSSIARPLNERCPISQQLFAPADRVARIRRCGHLCEPDALRRWFTYSVRCPMCRIDIREAQNHTTSAPAPARPERAPVAPSTPDNSTSLPPPTRLNTEADFASFASRIASELAGQLFQDPSPGTGNLTVEYAVVTPAESGGRTGASDEAGETDDSA